MLLQAMPESPTPISLVADSITADKLRFHELGLFGRDEELEILREAFERSRKKSREIIWIQGYAGCGKSALASTLRQIVFRSKGLYVYGKFDVHHSDEPYAGFMQTFRELYDMIMDPDVGSPFADFPTDIRQSFGDELQRASHDFSDIARLESDARHRFCSFVRNFFRLICARTALVWVWDDLQWADHASLELLELLATDHSNSSIMILGLYRDDHVDDKHPLFKCHQNIQSKSDGLRITTLRLGNLSVDHINQLLVELLSADPPELYHLSQIVHKKTHGNILSVAEFLLSLQHRQLLNFNYGEFRWEWNTQLIEAESRVTRNVVDILKLRIKGLAPQICQVAQLAACLGHRFKSSILELVVTYINRYISNKAILPNIDCENINDNIDILVQNDFVERTDDGLYLQWAHDCIQESMISSIPSDVLPLIQFYVGEVLFKHLSADDFESMLFVTVNLLNRGVGFQSELDRVKLAELNFRAAQKSSDLTAFFPAIQFLHTATNFLPIDRWITHYELTLEIFTLMAEVEYLAGDSKSSESHCEEILNHARSMDDKFRAYNVLIDSMGNRGVNLNSVIQLCLDVLAKLGCTFPKRWCYLHVWSGLQKERLRPYSVQKFPHLPDMTDKRNLQVMRVLDKLVTFAYQARSPLLPLASLKSLQWTKKHGLSDFTATALVVFGAIVVSKYEDLKCGRLFGEQGISILEKTCCDTNITRVYTLAYNFLLHWSIPLRHALKQLQSGYKIGMKTGDVGNGLWCIYGFLSFSIFSGKNLMNIASECHHYARQMQIYSQLKLYKLTLIAWQTALNLTGRSRNTLNLVGDAMDENIYLKTAKEIGDANFVAKHRMMQIFLSSIFGEYEEGVKLADKFIAGSHNGSRGSSGLYIAYFHIGLSYFAMAKAKKKRVYKKRGIQCLSKMKRWAKLGNPNVIHYKHLLQAELSALNGKHAVACKEFETGIKRAARLGFVNDQALANEHYGEFLLGSTGDHNEAAYRLSLAIELYREWGALRKVELLVQKHAVLLSHLESTTESSEL